MSYANRYSWFEPLGQHCIAHDDGSVSLMIQTQGYDIQMTDKYHIEGSWVALYEQLRAIDRRCVLEVHYFRENDDQVAQAYLSRNSEIVRAESVGLRIRQDIADHLSCYGRSNSHALILVMPRKLRFWQSAVRILKEQAKRAEELEGIAQRFLRYVHKGALAPVSDYEDMIVRSYSRTHWLQHKRAVIDHRFPIHEQIAVEKPQCLGDGSLKLADTYTRVGLVTLYPDADAGWFESYANISQVDVHISHIIEPINTRLAMAKADQQVVGQEGLRSHRGGEYVEEKIKEISGFKQFVAEHNLELFRNCFIVHFHSRDKQVLRQCWSEFENDISRGGRVISNKDIALAFFRFAQPGQGYRTSFMRPDHELQVANMMPLIAFDGGAKNPASLRLSNTGQLVGFDYQHNEANHAFTIAKTGGGKGVEKAATILETFPLGIDWYIAEVGTSYQWSVEACGGQYCHLDPDTTVVNPFPCFSGADSQAEFPFSSQIVRPTMDSLSFLLLDETRGFKAAESAVAEMAMQLLYVPCEGEVLSSSGSPGFSLYLEMLQLLSEDSALPDDQRFAGDLMAKNLNSFLSTSAGKIFMSNENFSINSGIFGVNFKPILGDRQLMIFYLVFVALRYSQLCFANNTASRILLDEIHVFSETHPEVVRRLVSQITRMGRKEAGSFDGVSQELSDMQMDPAVLNQINHRSLLYTQAGHDQIKNAVPNISDRALACWKNYPDPKTLSHMNYRQGVRMMGDRSWDLHLTFPQSVLDLANSDPDVLALKKEIGEQISDPFERLMALHKARSAHNVSV